MEKGGVAKPHKRLQIPCFLYKFLFAVEKISNLGFIQQQ